MDKVIKQAQELLMEHPLYRNISNIEELRLFMSRHVFAVWDFMSLSKRLQRELTCLNLPWTPPQNPVASQLINEIILYEESDTDMQGKPCSHLEMYLAAMGEVSADDSQFLAFLESLEKSDDIDLALRQASVPAYISKFVKNNLQIAMHGKLEEVASNFLYGREDAIPEMFTRLLGAWAIDDKNAPTMIHYLKRHIELDGDEHGPAAHEILNELLTTEEKTVRARTAAADAISARIELWDGILEEIQAKREHSTHVKLAAGAGTSVARESLDYA
ncbi:DUF3050 domain-containing protein [Microbulbifer litoralis]|uniref:DUF3050 domain-containing protein n=1 Tax=Microbulbifer litoralis TaxID=2933965 RepID=UPI00202973FC|nr:DUF3050 domain-containing protein [Microbulbifer sp. GX H0434]